MVWNHDPDSWRYDPSLLPNYSGISHLFVADFPTLNTSLAVRRTAKPLVLLQMDLQRHKVELLLNVTIASM